MPKIKPWGYVVCNDSFMSGWGSARGGRSLYALAVDGPAEAHVVVTNARKRSDMKRIRVQKHLPRIRQGDHLAIVDRTVAARWYEIGGF